MKALGIVVSDKKIFENCILKTYFFDPILMQPAETVWTTLVEEHLGIIPVKFRQNPMSGFGGEDVSVKQLTDDERQTTTNDGQRPVTIAHPYPGELKIIFSAKFDGLLVPVLVASLIQAQSLL